MRKFGRFEMVRHWARKFFQLPTHLNGAEVSHSSMFPKLHLASVLQTLERDGCYQGLQLPADIVDQLLDFVASTTSYIHRDKNQPCQIDRQGRMNGAVPPPTVRLCSYMDHSSSSEVVRKIETDPLLLAIAAQYLGAEPIHMGTELCWSFPAPATLDEQLSAAQVFHYDLDDYRLIKFFFYLTDVDATAGPHTYIRGSHKNKPFLHQLIGTRCASLSDEKIVECYGAENVSTICGPAGFGFIEDVVCFHRGDLPLEKPRLMFQMEFTVNRYGNIHEDWDF